MTALAAFFAMIPAAWPSNAAARPMPRWPGRFLGGLLAGEPATLFVLPAPVFI